MKEYSVLEKLSFIAFGIVLIAASWLQSCTKKQADVSIKPPTQNIVDIGKDIQSTGDSLKETTNNIKTNATEGMNKTPVPAKQTLDPYWLNILSSAGIQEQLVKNLEQAKTKVDDAEKKSIQFEEAYNKERAARVAAEDSVTRELRKKYMTYSGILFFIALICGGIAVFAGGNKIALYGGLLAGAGSAACIFIVQTVQLIPWIVGGMALIGLGLMVYTLFFKNKKHQILTKATEELVETVEAAKPRMTLQGRKDVFGDGPAKGDAYSIQSKETEQLVKSIRSNIEKAPSVPSTIAVDWNGDGIVDEKDVAPTDSTAETIQNIPKNKKILILK